MTRAARNVLLIMVAALLCAFGSKLFWDEYQMKRAVKQSPIVVALLDEIRAFPDSSRIESKYEGPSVNEYAAATWRYYRADAKCAAIQKHLDSEALRNGFEFDSIGHQNGGTQVYHRKGEYEMRSMFEPQNSADCNYAVSVNWFSTNWIDLRYFGYDRNTRRLQAASEKGGPYKKTMANER